MRVHLKDRPLRPIPSSIDSQDRKEARQPVQTKPDFAYVPRPPESRVVTKQNWVGTGIAGGVALLVLVVSGFLYFGAKSDLDETETELAAVKNTLHGTEDELQASQDDLDATQTTLRNTEGDLADAKEKLATNERTLNSVAKCSYRMLEAWFETTNYSYTVTGIALQRAIYSRVCAVSRSAYQST
jgi:uncharacterized protein HemX